MYLYDGANYMYILHLHTHVSMSWKKDTVYIQVIMYALSHLCQSIMCMHDVVLHTCVQCIFIPFNVYIQYQYTFTTHVHAYKGIINSILVHIMFIFTHTCTLTLYSV